MSTYGLGDKFNKLQLITPFRPLGNPLYVDESGVLISDLLLSAATYQVRPQGAPGAWRKHSLTLQCCPLAIIFPSVTFRGLYCHFILFISTPLRSFFEREVLAVRQRPSPKPSPESTRQSVTPIACLRRRVNYLPADALAMDCAGLSGQEGSLLYQAIHQRPRIFWPTCPRRQTEINLNGMSALAACQTR